MSQPPAPPSLPVNGNLSADELVALNGFLALSQGDVEALALRTLRHSPVGTTWLGLSNLMERQGYAVVRDLGLPAALSWARHLGLVGEAASSARPTLYTGANDAY